MPQNEGRLFHLLNAHRGTGKPTGVPRFSMYFQWAFPDVINITPRDVTKVEPDDIIVTDNHLSMMVPRLNQTIVVHHGCAATHYDRDHTWQNSNNLEIVHLQDAMFEVPNRRYVAPSAWVAREFKARLSDNYPYIPSVIPHWVPRPERLGRVRSDKPIIIGDWRGHNKGEEVARELARRNPQWEFRRLEYNPASATERDRFYADADLYLCLSLSEGAPYSVADAEAALLPIVTTNVGNVDEFNPFVIPNRKNWDGVAAVIRKALGHVRVRGFYSGYSFERWTADWQSVIKGAKARQRGGAD